MQYLRARYYAAQQGRFISEDPYPGTLSQPASLTPYIYALNNPLRYTDPSGKYVESPLDVAFIVYDVGSIIWDVNRIQQNTCHSGELIRQLWIDAGALAIDVIFLALPGATGGGMGLRYALAGANLTYDTARLTQLGYIGLRGVQGVTKGIQVGNRISFFQKFGSSYNQSPLPGMEEYFKDTKGQEHHFVTNKGEYWPKIMRQITDKYGLDLNGGWNRDFIEMHNGRHTDSYHQWVFNRLSTIDKIANGNVDTFLDLFDSMIKEPIMTNPALLYK